jgi:branched-chain amino acid transport system ATP-binding protein
MRSMVLQLEHVTKDFEGLRAVDDVSLSVDEGAIIGLIGPNGSGKSTLLNLISGMAAPSAGKIIFDGHDISNQQPDTIFQLGLARGFQDPSLFFQLTVLDNTLLPIKHQRGEHPLYAILHGSWMRQEQSHSVSALDALKRINLREHFGKRAADLSGGQMKLAEMARSVMGNPKMLLLDEPTAGVAPNLAYSIFEQIDVMRRELGITFLIVEHRLEILFNFVDSVYVMHLGKLLAQGSPAEIATNEDVREVYFGD